MQRREDTGVVLVVHGNYGRPMVDAAEAIVGPLDVRVASVFLEADTEQVRRSIGRELDRMGLGAGVLVLTDLFGSTPANVCQGVVEDRPGCVVLAGLNLSMLIKLSTCDRSLGARQIAEELQATGRRSIVVCSGLVNGGTCGD